MSDSVDCGFRGEVITVRNKLFPSNTYICPNVNGDECFLVDPGTDPDLIRDALNARGLRPTRIYLTHGHFDHAGSAADFQDEYDVDVVLHVADEKTLKACNFLLMACKIPFRMGLPAVRLIDEFMIEIEGKSLAYVHSPGHTPGSCLIKYGDVYFSGDTLFLRGIGEPRLPGGNSGQLRSTLRGLLDLIPLDSMIFPGHGEPAVFGRILEENQKMREFIGISGFAIKEN